VTNSLFRFRWSIFFSVFPPPPPFVLFLFYYHPSLDSVSFCFPFFSALQCSILPSFPFELLPHPLFFFFFLFGFVVWFFFFFCVVRFGRPKPFFPVSFFACHVGVPSWFYSAFFSPVLLLFTLGPPRFKHVIGDFVCPILSPLQTSEHTHPFYPPP